MADYYAILTHIGEAKLARASALGVPLEITHLAVGDGEGQGAQGTPLPDPARTALRSERRRAPLNTLTTDPTNANVLVAEQVIPEDVGGWWIREMGLYDIDGDLLAVCNAPPTYKPVLASGSGRTQVVRMQLIVSNASAVTLKVDPAVILATRKHVEDRIAVLGLPEHIRPSTFLRARLDGRGYEALTAQQVLEELHALPADRYEFDLPLTAIADEPGTLGYKSEPQLVYCADGSILCVYRRGSAHVSNDGRIVAKRSTDLGRTWGAEILVHDHASGYDTRNPTVGIDPASGRLIAFSRTLNATGDYSGTHQALFYQTSADHGATWGAAVDISGLFSDITADGLVAFGPIIRTAKGLLQLVYGGDKTANRQFCFALFSTDGGQTWGNRSTVYNVIQASATFTESVPVRVDDDRIVVLVRDEQSPGYYWYTKSGDGGLTWGGFVDRFGAQRKRAWMNNPDDPALRAAPLWGVSIGDTEVVCAWGGRGEAQGLFGVLYMQRLHREAFWERPFWGWSSSTELRQRISMSKVGHQNNANWSEWSYPCLLEVPGVRHTALIAWYDSKDGTNTTETDIWITTLPR